MNRMLGDHRLNVGGNVFGVPREGLLEPVEPAKEVLTQEHLPYALGQPLGRCRRAEMKASAPRTRHDRT